MLKTASIPDYAKTTGLSRATIKKMIAEGTLQHIKTPGGGKTLVAYEENDKVIELIEKVEVLQGMVKQLCNHLGLTQSHEYGREFYRR